ncbi:MAG: NAD(P)/FAD-dependent oxidoreductase [Chloroflexota bacterium]
MKVMADAQKVDVAILGAGFAGTAVAQKLSKLLRANEATVTLVDRNNFFLFTPMLTEVAGDEAMPRDIVSAARTMAPRATFEQGWVESIDPSTRSFTVCIGSQENNVPETRRTISAGQLVIALGSVINFYGIKGLAEHAYTLKSLADAATLRNRVLALLERADEESNPEARRALLTFVVGGGGSSGVETIAALNAFVRELRRKFPRVRPDDVRTMIVEAGPSLLGELRSGLGAYAEAELKRQGVEVAVGTKVTEAGPASVTVDPPINGQSQIPTHTLIWAGGIAPNPLVEALDLPKGKHGIQVDECGRVPGHAGIWALGDLAEYPKPGGGTYPALAQNAQREGEQAGRNLVALLRGKQPEPFRYKPMGELVLIGKHRAVASIMGYNVTGFFAWMAWRGIYLAKLPTFQQRVLVAGSWLLDLLFGRDMAQVPGASTGKD